MRMVSKHRPRWDGIIADRERPLFAFCLDETGALLVTMRQQETMMGYS